MARLRGQLSADQLVTFRYEDVVRQPADAAAAISDFLSTPVHILEPGLPGHAAAAEPGSWRRRPAGPGAGRRDRGHRGR